MFASLPPSKLRGLMAPEKATKISCLVQFYATMFILISQMLLSFLNLKLLNCGT